MIGRSGQIGNDPVLLAIGEPGLSILEAIELDALPVDSIHVVTGLPVACITGRIPVLEDLGLIVRDGANITITVDGRDTLDLSR